MADLESKKETKNTLFLIAQLTSQSENTVN